LDHMTPISRGGEHTTDNLQWLCETCNLKKGTRTDEEYRAILDNPEDPFPNYTTP
jgi:5-methylcytosine-specific restriction endonuclease McrA